METAQTSAKTDKLTKGFFLYAPFRFRYNRDMFEQMQITGGERFAACDHRG